MPIECVDTIEKKATTKIPVHEQYLSDQVCQAQQLAEHVFEPVESFDAGQFFAHVADYFSIHFSIFIKQRFYAADQLALFFRLPILPNVGG